MSFFILAYFQYCIYLISKRQLNIYIYIEYSNIIFQDFMIEKYAKSLTSNILIRDIDNL